MTDSKPKGRRRGVKRTVLVLFIIVISIYLFFIGRAFVNYPGG